MLDFCANMNVVNDTTILIFKNNFNKKITSLKERTWCNAAHEGVRLLFCHAYLGMFLIPAKCDKHWALINCKDLNLSNMPKTLGNTIKDDDHSAKDGIKKLSQSKIQCSPIANLE